VTFKALSSGLSAAFLARKAIKLSLKSWSLLLLFQTHRELVKLAEGTGFRIHMIHKAAEAAKKFGPTSSKKYGNCSSY